MGLIEVTVHYLGEVARVYEDSLNIPGGNFKGDDWCIIVRRLYALKVFIRKA